VWGEENAWIGVRRGLHSILLHFTDDSQSTPKADYLPFPEIGAVSSMI
jgi:hypothetical protein